MSGRVLLIALGCCVLTAGCGTPGGNPCEGVECGAHAVCVQETGNCTCELGFQGAGDGCEVVPCQVPRGPVLATVHAGAELSFRTAGDLPVEVGTSSDPESTRPDTWQPGNQIALPSDHLPGQLRAFARVEGCPLDNAFSHVYRVAQGYPPAAGQAESTAIARDDPGIVGWAASIVSTEYGEGVEEDWQVPERALGPAQGDGFDVVSLGRGGEIVLEFDPPIADGQGPDLAVFENAFSDTYLELGFVEVSSDGKHFLRFDHAYRGEDPLDAFGNHDTTLIGSLAGKYRQGWGTPFDLALLRYRLEVDAGLVDLDAIRYVKIVDVVGDGKTTDSFGHVIYDPYPTASSAGFDLDAVGALCLAE